VLDVFGWKIRDDNVVALLCLIRGLIVGAYAGSPKKLISCFNRFVVFLPQVLFIGDFDPEGQALSKEFDHPDGLLHRDAHDSSSGTSTTSPRLLAM
jgi:hypothetical protein